MAKFTHREIFDEVIMSGRYQGRMAKIKQTAQMIYANDRTQPKEDVAWMALEKYEDMTGFSFDPTHEQFDEIVASII